MGRRFSFGQHRSLPEVFPIRAFAATPRNSWHRGGLPGPRRMNDDDEPDVGLISTLSPTRRIMRSTVAVFLLAFFLVTLLASYRLGTAVAVSAAVLYALVQCLVARFCVTCGQSVLGGSWSRQVVPCPGCGSECRRLWRT